MWRFFPSVVLPAWVLGQPVVWAFKDPLHHRFAAFTITGVLWGPAFTYGIRLASLRKYAGLRYQPNLFDGIALSVSTVATLFYLLLLKHFPSKRIQSN